MIPIGDSIPTLYARIPKHKYRAIKTVIEGITFPSKKEAQFFQGLLLQKRGKAIKDFRRQVPFGLKAKTRTGREYRYVLDFEITQNDNSKTFIEVKGYKTPLGELKRALAEYFHGIAIEVV